MTLYPEIQKQERIRKYHESGVKLYVAGWDTECGRCGQIIRKGEQLVWVRQKGSFHPENPCPTQADEEA
jgi:hypothetical protein